MADQAIHEMVAAFASGCMDSTNYENFTNYMNSGGNLPHGELGELQNLMVLIPTVLDIESPPPELKNEVAKSLIKLQKKSGSGRLIGNVDDIEEPIIKKESRPPFPQPEEETQSQSDKKAINRKDFLPSREEILGEVESVHSEKDNSDVRKQTIPIPSKPEPTNDRQNEEEVRRRKQESYQDVPRLTDSPGPSIPNIRDILESHDPGFTKWHKNNLFIIVSAAVILILLMAWFYTGYESHLEEYRSEIAKLKSDNRKSSEFINNHRSLISFFNYPDIQLATLEGTEETVDAAARILLAFEEGEGLIKTSNLFPAQGDNIYQLWLESRGGFYSLLKFQANNDGKFLNFSNFPYIPPGDVSGFRITIEPTGGSESPSGRTVLIGSFSAR